VSFAKIMQNQMLVAQFALDCNNIRELYQLNGLIGNAGNITKHLKL
jgi:hypothetical protein